MGALLRMPLDAVRQRMLDDFHGAGSTDLAPAHSAVLRYPGPHGRRPSDLAAVAGMTRQAMNYLLGELEQRGYLVRRDDPVDKRSRRIELTKRGTAALRVMRKSVLGIEAEHEGELGHDGLVQRRQMLAALISSTFVRAFGEQTSHPRVVLDSPACATIARRSAGERLVDADGDGRRGVGH